MRNHKWEKLELVHAVLYLVDNGYKWRALPHDFPPTVHSFYRRARLSGLWDKILEHLVRLTRKNAGLEENPTVALVDSQTVQNSSSSEQSGYDPGKFVYSTIKNFVRVIEKHLSLMSIQCRQQKPWLKFLIFTLY